jgi:multiple antibiotic resistance protein
MEHESIIFTMLFLAIGPIKIIPAFFELTQDFAPRDKRRIAIKSVLLATAIALILVFVGRGLLSNYGISQNAVQIGGGVILLLSALNIIFPPVQINHPKTHKPTNAQLIINLATPGIIPPFGTAIILLFTMAAPSITGMDLAIANSLITIMTLNFLAMFFADKIMKISGFMEFLQILGAIFTFMQVALAFELILDSLNRLGLFQ